MFYLLAGLLACSGDSGGNTLTLTHSGPTTATVGQPSSGTDATESQTETESETGETTDEQTASGSGMDGCGDGVCGGLEYCAVCPVDCGSCEPKCGDGFCNAGETCEACEEDCGACADFCGDQSCSSQENLSAMSSRLWRV